MPSSNMYTLSPLERVRYLTTVGFLRDLPTREVALVAENVTERSFRRGQQLLPGGRIPSGMHVIVEGRVRVPGVELGSTIVAGLKTSDGTEQLDARIGETFVRPGESVGLLSLLARSETGHEAIADTDASTLEIGADVLMDLLEDRFPLVLGLVQRIARHTLGIRQQIEDGAVLSAGRVFEEALAGPTDLTDRLVWLRKGRIFRKASVESLIRLASTLEEVRLPAGQLLWRAGEKAGYALFVLAGHVRCTLPDGRHFFADGGYPLGNLESQAGSLRWFEAVTVVETVMIRSDIEVMHDLLEDDFDLAVEFLAAQADGLLALVRKRGEPIPF